ncbi:MAG TPA: S9 family peptidase [Thermomicrobiales bacterium]|nr:S9 family peptidase [Thermomicrobiales bacterium]
MPKIVTLPDPGWDETSVAAQPTVPQARDGRPITIEDLYRFRMVGDPQVSPDGNSILTTLLTIDRATDEYRAAIWRMDANGSNQRQLTSGMWRDSAPQWSPDGRWIAFRSRRDDSGSQLWVMPTDGGEPTRITSLEHGVVEHAWSPDSEKLVVVSPVEMKRDESDADVRVITSAHYKFNGRGFLDERYPQLFVVDRAAPEEEPLQLSSGRFLHRMPAWSPDGREIAFVANRDPDWDTSRISDIWTVPARGGEPRRITDGAGSYSQPVWSPDGTRLAFVGSAVLDRVYRNTHLWVVPAAGGTPTNVSGSIDRSIGDSSMSGPKGDTSGPPLRWTGDGGSIDALVSDRGSTRIVRFPLGKGKVTALTGLDHHVMGFDHLGSNRLVVTVADATTPAELAIITRKEMTRITDFNGEWLADVAVATPEEIVLDVDGTPVQGWLLRPKHTAPGVKRPLILNIHGGPHAQYSSAFFHELQVYPANGYGLLFINPRGSVGYGERFASAVSGAWGLADTQDFEAMLEHVVSQDGWDTDRLGVTGGSYGGFMTNWLLGHTDHFRTAVTDRSITNMTSMYGTDDIALVSLDPELGTPWEHPDRFWELSPIRAVANITAPLLIIHSEEDYRCPMEQAEQLFIALKRLGREVEFVRYQGENHELSRSGKPKNRRDRLERTIGWFDRTL